MTDSTLPAGDLGTSALLSPDRFPACQRLGLARAPMAQAQA